MSVWVQTCTPPPSFSKLVLCLLWTSKFSNANRLNYQQPFFFIDVLRMNYFAFVICFWITKFILQHSLATIHFWAMHTSFIGWKLHPITSTALKIDTTDKRCLKNAYFLLEMLKSTCTTNARAFATQRPDMLMWTKTPLSTVCIGERSTSRYFKQFELTQSLVDGFKKKKNRIEVKKFRSARKSYLTWDLRVCSKPCF